MEADNTFDNKIIIRYLSGRSSAAEKEILGKKLSQDPVFEQDLERLEKIWIKSQNLQLPATKKQDTAKAWENVKQSIKDDKNKTKDQDDETSLAQRKEENKMRKKMAIRIIMALIATIAIVLLSIKLLVHENETVLYEAKRGGEKNIQLGDGSVVHLFSHSSLYYPQNYLEESRNVFLNGEGKFTVVQHQIPFTVDVWEQKLQTNEANFYINARDARDTLLVVVSKGVVLLYAHHYGRQDVKPEDVIRISAGETGAVIRNTGAQMLLNEDQEALLPAYNDETLGGIFDDIQTIYSLPVHVTHAEIRKCIVSTPAAMHLDKLIDYLTSTLRVSIIKKEGELVVAGKGCDR